MTLHSLFSILWTHLRFESDQPFPISKYNYRKTNEFIYLKIVRRMKTNGVLWTSQVILILDKASIFDESWLIIKADNWFQSLPGLYTFANLYFGVFRDFEHFVPRPFVLRVFCTFTSCTSSILHLEQLYLVCTADFAFHAGDCTSLAPSTDYNISTIKGNFYL